MSRLIDNFPEPGHVVKKKVIVLSRSRVGTFSLYQAMNMLGYKTYHMFETVMDGPRTMNILTEALRCKYSGQGKPYGKAEFDKWMPDYEVIIEIPQYFVEEFIEAYPDAKFILVERSLESWMKSIRSTAGEMFKACRSFPLYHAGLFDRYLGAFNKLHWAIEDAYFDHQDVDAGEHVAIEAFKRDSRIARERVPKDQLLICRLEDGFGWEQICPFLEKDIPSTPYPRGNAPAQFHKLGDELLTPKLKKVGLICLSSVLVPVAGVAAWFYMRK